MDKHKDILEEMDRINENRPGMMIYFDDMDTVRKLLQPDELGQLLCGMLDFARCGAEDPFSDRAMELAFGLVKPKILRDAKKYVEETLKKQYAAYKRDHTDKTTNEGPSRDQWEREVFGRSVSDDIESYHPMSHDNKGNLSVSESVDVSVDEDEKVAGTASVRGYRDEYKDTDPPTLDEVTAYCQERGNAVDPHKFFDYYAARGWELKPGQKIKDWKACLRTWEHKKQVSRIPTSEKPICTSEDIDRMDGYLARMTGDGVNEQQQKRHGWGAGVFGGRPESV